MPVRLMIPVSVNTEGALVVHFDPCFRRRRREARVPDAQSQQTHINLSESAFPTTAQSLLFKFLNALTSRAYNTRLFDSILRAD